MKDYFDLWILARHSDFDGKTLGEAIHATFTRRQTAIPPETPMGLTMEFAQDAQKQTQWQAFLRKNALKAPALRNIVLELHNFLMPATNSHPGKWTAGGVWEEK